MERSHLLILLGGALGLASILAGVASRRLGAPVLLIFLLLGMLAGEDGPLGLPYDDFATSYLVGSLALAVILFEGGLSTDQRGLRAAFWPALLLATVGVIATALITGLAAHWIAGAPFAAALLIGAALAPTDAGAVAALLRQARLAVPKRVIAVLEVESGLNDPMSVFLTLVLVQQLLRPGEQTAGDAALLFLRAMGGGGVLGLIGGGALTLMIRFLSLPRALVPATALAFACALFGGAQALETSGFLAVYVAGMVAGRTVHPPGSDEARFFEALSWMAQIVLFLMLGLLVTPHRLLPLIPPMLGVECVLIAVARPLATFACMAPFKFSGREMAFASWVGLRGAVPIYLAVIPVLAGVQDGPALFGAAFVLVLVSLVVQGWTISAAGRALGFKGPRLASSAEAPP